MNDEVVSYVLRLKTYQFESETLGLTLTWNITAALALHRDHWEIYTTDVAPLAKILADGGAEVDPEWAMSDNVDLTQPLIALTIPTTDETILVDGWHRVYRASRDGVEILPLVLLDAAEERAVRLSPSDSEILSAHMRSLALCAICRRPPGPDHVLDGFDATGAGLRKFSSACRSAQLRSAADRTT